MGDLSDDEQFEQNLLSHVEKVENDYYSETGENEKDGPKREHLEVLTKSFGHKKFRAMQWKIIKSLIDDRRDNCAIMATGYGKSLCYQYPSAFLGGLTLVISPLISLMEDQVLAMQVTNISACLLGTANTKQKQTIADILQGKYSLVYLTPEFCTGDYGKDLLQKMYTQLSISLIAIDEAHCVSSWGHDFRSHFRHLGILKEIMPDVPILAVTATATPRVRDDIMNVLKLQNPQISCSGFDRPNLFLSVNLKTNLIADLHKVMERQGGEWRFAGPTIIYCLTRKQTEEISSIVAGTGIKCLPYHAGLNLSVRKDTHEKFIRDKIEVITATIAFGMGIDKPDVRNIIHYGASNSLEGYYQEVGRAGRDGLPSKCVIFYSNSDFEFHRHMRETAGTNKANKENMADLVRDYVTSRNCRRQIIISHFEGKTVIPPKRPVCCDNCSRKNLNPDSETYEGVDVDGNYDFTEDARILLETINELNGKFGWAMYMLFLRGSHSSKVAHLIKSPLYGSGRHKTVNWWKGIGALLEREKFLDKSFTKKQTYSYSTIHVSSKGNSFLKDVQKGIKLKIPPTPELFECLKIKTNAWLGSGSGTLSTQKQPPNISFFVIPTMGEEIDQSNKKLHELLVNKRYELATIEDCMPYSVASTKAIVEMTLKRPTTLQEFRECELDAFTELKISKFGNEFVKVIKSALCLYDGEPHNKMSIQDILTKFPLSGTKVGMTAEASYSLYKTGMTPQEIADRRGVNIHTVTNHLVDCMKLGYPIKLIELGVTREIKEAVMNAVKKVDTGLRLLTPIKNLCPPDLTFIQVKAVVVYLRIRQHLSDTGFLYEDFESDNDIASSTEEKCIPHPAREEYSPVPSTSRQKSVSPKLCEENAAGPSNIDSYPDSQLPSNLTQLIRAIKECDQFSDKGEDSNFSEGFADDELAAVCDELETSLIEHSGEATTDSCEPPSKRSKVDDISEIVSSVLDSPPRQSQFNRKLNVNNNAGMSGKSEVQEESIPSTSKSEPVASTSKNKDKVSLPPWLVRQRIA